MKIINPSVLNIFSILHLVSLNEFVTLLANFLPSSLVSALAVCCLHVVIFLRIGKRGGTGARGGTEKDVLASEYAPPVADERGPQ